MVDWDTYSAMEIYMNLYLHEKKREKKITIHTVQNVFLNSERY